MKTCPRCHSKVCLACGEPISPDHEKHVATREDPLFHCSNLQGVILGVGLTMVEQLFSQEDQQDSLDASDAPTRNSKRRRTDQTSQNDVDDDDVVYYANVGKKAKGGTGYDGDVTEDVRVSFISKTEWFK